MTFIITEFLEVFFRFVFRAVLIHLTMNGTPDQTEQSYIYQQQPPSIQQLHS